MNTTPKQGEYIALAVDPGKTSGFAVARVRAAGACTTLDIIEAGYIEVDCSSPFTGDWCIDLQRQLDALALAHGAPDVVGVEDYFFSKRTCTGAGVNAALRTALHMWSRARGVPYEVLGICAWKAFVCGHSRPTRAQKAEWGATRANKEFVAHALRVRHGLALPERVPSAKGGARTVAFKHDTADALAQCIYLAHVASGGSISVNWNSHKVAPASTPPLRELRGEEVAPPRPQLRARAPPRKTQSSKSKTSESKYPTDSSDS